MIFSDGGNKLLLALTEFGEGYAATFDLGLDLTDADVGAADGGRGYPSGPGGGPPPGKPGGSGSS